MTKFPVVRDLMVDRSRLFASLEKIKAWVPVDSYYDMGPGPRQSQEQQEFAYEYSKCMSCGCCLEACPQFLKMELLKQADETQEQFRARLREAADRSFIGAHAIAQVDLFNMNPIGAMNAGERLDALTAEGGIQVCGNAAELREGLSQGPSANHRHRPRRPGRDDPFLEEDLRLVSQILRQKNTREYTGDRKIRSENGKGITN